MLHDKYLKNAPVGSTGIIPLPATGKTAQYFLGAALFYAAVGAPGSEKVIREISAIIDKPKFFAKVVTGSVGAFLVFNASS